jgi:hypothetical protein
VGGPEGLFVEVLHSEVRLNAVGLIAWPSVIAA